MYSIHLDKQWNSWYSIDGLPRLDIHIKQSSFFDGYITSAYDLSRLYVTKDYSEVIAMNAKVMLQEHIPLTDVQNGKLGTLELLQSWARVQVVERISPSQAKVYLLDTGVTKNVDISHLFEMNAELKTSPPLCFPIRYAPHEVLPEMTSEDMLSFRAAKLALKLDDASPETEFRTSEVTVFEQLTKRNLPLLEAVKARNIRLQGISFTLSPTFKVDAPYGQGAVAEEHKGSNSGLMAIVGLTFLALCGGLAIGGMIIYLRRIRDRHEQPQPIPEFARRRDGPEAPVTAAISPITRNDSNETETEAPIAPVESKLKKETVATIAASIALGQHIYDEEKKNPNNQLNASEMFHYSTESNDSVTGPKSRAEGGLSGISPIISSSPMLFTRYCSTPLSKSVNNINKSQQQHQKAVETIVSQPTKTSPISSPCSFMPRSSPMSNNAYKQPNNNCQYSNPKGFCTSPSGNGTRDMASEPPNYLDISQYSDMPEVQQILTEYCGLDFVTPNETYECTDPHKKCKEIYDIMDTTVNVGPTPMDDTFYSAISHTAISASMEDITV